MRQFYTISLVIIVVTIALVALDSLDNKKETLSPTPIEVTKDDPVIFPIANEGNEEKTKESSLAKEIPETKLATTPEKEIPEAKLATTPEEVAEQKPLILLPINELNEKARMATVNIFCVSKSGGALEPASGSGVIIDPKGIVLTNAHVAQYFLLQDYLVKNFLDCDIRTGNIAKETYKAKLLYLSPLWIEKNAKNIIEQRPKGIGENDFAFLLITSTTKGEISQTTFPYLAINSAEEIPVGLPVLLTSYPAGLLGGVNVALTLGLLSTLSTIKELFTFSEEAPQHLDLLSLGGNIAAQSGSSGGAVTARTSGELIGLITTNTKAATTDEADLRAITLSHIDRSIQKQTGENLATFLAKDPQETSKAFHETEFGRLKELLEAVLTGEN